MCRRPEVVHQTVSLHMHASHVRSVVVVVGGGLTGVACARTSNNVWSQTKTQKNSSMPPIERCRCHESERRRKRMEKGERKKISENICSTRWATCFAEICASKDVTPKTAKQQKEHANKKKRKKWPNENKLLFTCIFVSACGSRDFRAATLSLTHNTQYRVQYNFRYAYWPLDTRKASGTATPAAPTIKSIDVIASQCFEISHSEGVSRCSVPFDPFV